MAALDHVRYQVPARQQGAVSADLHRPAPLLERVGVHVEQVSLRRAAERGVDEHVDPLEARDDLIGHPLRVGGRGDVGGDRQHVAADPRAAASDACRDSGKRDDRDVGAGGGEPAPEHRAEAGPGAHDHGHLVVEADGAFSRAVHSGRTVESPPPGGETGGRVSPRRRAYRGARVREIGGPALAGRVRVVY